MVYIVLLIFFFLGALIYDFRKTKQSGKFYFCVECFSLIVLWGLRFRVGGDSLRYEEHFSNYPDFSEIVKMGLEELFTMRFQPLWYVINGLIKSTFDSFILFQIVDAIIVNAFIFRFIWKHCHFKFIASFLFYLCFSSYYNTEILREGFAVMVFMYSYHYILEKKYFKYYFFCIIAFLFHISAILCFFAPFFYSVFRSKLAARQIFLIIVCSLVFSIMINVLAGALIEQAFINDTNAEKIENDSSVFLNIKGMIGSFIAVIPTLIIIFVLNKTNQSNKYTNSVLGIYLLLQVIGSNLLILNRFQNYFHIIVLALMVDTVFSNLHISRFRPILMASLTLYVMCRCYLYIGDYSKSNYNKEAHYYDLYIPYHSIFDPEFEPVRETIATNQF